MESRPNVLTTDVGIYIIGPDEFFYNTDLVPPFSVHILRNDCFFAEKLPVLAPFQNFIFLQSPRY